MVPFLVKRVSAAPGAALINFFAPNAALIRGRWLFGGGTYSSKYGKVNLPSMQFNNRTLKILLGGDNR